MKNESVFFYFFQSNKKYFFILLVLFFIGISGGIFFINHVGKSQSDEISTYVNSLKDNIKTTDDINRTAILLKSLKQNLIFVVTVWLFGCTIFANIYIFFAIFYKGFSIGYTVSAIIGTLGIRSR